MNAKEPNTASLIDELGTPLVRYLAKKVRNNEDANDLAHEAFLRMHRFQQSSELDNARAFLFRTANNLVIDQIRRDKVHDKYLSSEMLPEQSDENEDSENVVVDTNTDTNTNTDTDTNIDTNKDNIKEFSEEVEEEYRNSLQTDEEKMDYLFAEVSKAEPEKAV